MCVRLQTVKVTASVRTCIELFCDLNICECDRFGCSLQLLVAYLLPAHCFSLRLFWCAYRGRLAWLGIWVKVWKLCRIAFRESKVGTLIALMSTSGWGAGKDGVQAIYRKQTVWTFMRIKGNFVNNGEYTIWVVSLKLLGELSSFVSCPSVWRSTPPASCELPEDKSVLGESNSRQWWAVLSVTRGRMGPCPCVKTAFTAS